MIEFIEPTDPPAVRYLLACDALAGEPVGALYRRFVLLEQRDSALFDLRRELGL